MEKVEILAVCSHEGILKTIVRLINNNSLWNATGAVTIDEALKLLHAQAFGLVLIGSGINAEDEERLRSALAEKDKQVPVIQHYGGGSGLLFGEIYQALGK